MFSIEKFGWRTADRFFLNFRRFFIFSFIFSRTADRFFLNFRPADSCPRRAALKNFRHCPRRTFRGNLADISRISLMSAPRRAAIVMRKML